MPNPKLVAASKPTAFDLPQVDGKTMRIGGPRENWSLIVIYRGKHCPRCKKYLNILNGMRADWHAAGFDILVASADPLEKARADVDEFGWEFDLAYDLTEEHMVQLGLFISDPLSANETDRRFAEPGTFVLRPDGSAVLIAISNGPSARPELGELLDGMIFTKENDRPARGEV